MSYRPFCNRVPSRRAAAPSPSLLRCKHDVLSWGSIHFRSRQCAAATYITQHFFEFMAMVKRVALPVEPEDDRPRRASRLEPPSDASFVHALVQRILDHVVASGEASDRHHVA